MRAEKIYVHVDDRNVAHLLAMHVNGTLHGNPIPPEYTVHYPAEVDGEMLSVNVVLTNGGGPVNTQSIADKLVSCKIFGKKVTVGNFGFEELLPN
jgi:hypothetical protein